MIQIKNKEEKISLLILIIFCLIMFFAFIGTYPLVDVDETRYVRIAQEMLNSHNFLTPVINGEIFLEKAPLFFWIEDLFFLIFGVSEWSARLPMGIIASFGVLMTYFIGKKLVSARFGLIAALVLGSSEIYIILSHIAILDLLLSVTMMISAYFGILTLYSQSKIQNWLYWAGFYLFSSLSVLSKGLPGIIIPFAVVFFGYFFSKKIKELFDYKKIFAGLILMALIILPWHMLMYKVHGQIFIDEYIIKHHIARFLNSEGINRNRPFLFYVPIIIGGCIPFIFVHITALVNEIKKIFVNFKNGFNLDIFKYFSPDIPLTKRFLSINIMVFVIVFLFFSVSSTKLPTYILPAVFPIAFIAGYIFNEYMENNKFVTQIKIANIITSVLFLLVSIFGAAICIILFKNSGINSDIIEYLKISTLCIAIIFGIYSVYNFVCLKKGLSQKHFLYSSVILMLSVTMTLNLCIFNLMASFGQNDLIKFARYAKNNELKLATFDFGNRYSVIYYYDNHVDIQPEANYKWLEEKLNNDYVVIMKNSNMVTMPSDVKFEVIETGNKYTLVKKQSED